MGHKRTPNFVPKLLILLLFFSFFLFPILLRSNEKAPLHPSISSEEVEAKPKICLTMIVKDDANTLLRCLNSLNGIVDCISVCDLGSSDNTVAILEEYMQITQIPGKVHLHEWQSFEQNRTLALEAAQKLLEELDFSLADTYLLVLDADTTLDIEPHFAKDSLTDDSYRLEQKNPSFSHAHTRLMRASMPWKCLGVSNENWVGLIPRQESKLLTLTINDCHDDNSKIDKYRQQAKLLSAGISQEHPNAHYAFHLARTYDYLKQYEEAIKWYQVHVHTGGKNDEAWYSKCRLGNCYEELNQWDEALRYYLDAYQFNPERAEPISKIARYYRSKELHNLAYYFAKTGSRLPQPSEQALFVFQPVYDYMFDEDISISAFYTPFKEEGYEATNRLILNRKTPHYTRHQAYQNILYYVQNLKGATYQPIVIDFPLINEKLATRYNPMNPSIKKTKTGYSLICRTVNYIQIAAKHFKSLDLFDPLNTIRTRNFLVQYDRDFKVLGQQEIIENLPRNHQKCMNIEGLEDCRIFEYKNASWFTCTTLDTNPCLQPQISLCKLSNDRSAPSVPVEKFIPLFGPDPRRCEKNWLPFLIDGELHVVYSYDPFIIYKPRVDDEFSIINDAVKTHHIVPKYNFTWCTGSAAPIKFDNGYLMLVHENVYQEQRNYLHRFLYLDKNFNILKASKPFIFLHKGIEYCCSITLDHSMTKLVLPIGIEDREAYLCSIDLDTVRSMLEPLY